MFLGKLHLFILAAIIQNTASSTLPITIKGVSNFSISPTAPSTLISAQSYSPCRVKIVNPRPGDRFRPGDEINVKWDLIGSECRNSTDGLVSLHQINAILFTNLTRNDEWKWNYRLVIITAAYLFIFATIFLILIFFFKNLYQEINTNITSFTYPIQIILSPNIRNSSLFFLDIELTFTKNPPGLIFDVMGPFTILPIPEIPLLNETNTYTDNGQDIFSSWTRYRKGNSNFDNLSNQNCKSTADILEMRINVIFGIFVIIFIIFM